MNHARNGRHFYDSATRPTYRRVKYIRDKSNLIDYTRLFSFFYLVLQHSISLFLVDR